MKTIFFFHCGEKYWDGYKWADSAAFYYDWVEAMKEKQRIKKLGEWKKTVKLFKYVFYTCTME